MIDPALPLQAALRALLAGDGNVTGYVPAASILDADQRPGVMPCILFGQVQVIPDDGLARDRFEVHADLHVWQIETGTTFVKQTVSAIRSALYDWRPEASGLEIADLYIESSRVMRDPDTVHSHAAVTLCARVRALS